MFLNIRTGVFETNSSYTHALALSDKKLTPPALKDDLVYFFEEDSEFYYEGTVGKCLNCPNDPWIETFMYYLLLMARRGRREIYRHMLGFFKEQTGRELLVCCEFNTVDLEVTDYRPDKSISVKFSDGVKTYPLFTQAEIERFGIKGYEPFENNAEDLHSFYYDENGCLRENHYLAVRPNENLEPLGDIRFDSGYSTTFDMPFAYGGCRDITDEELAAIIENYLCSGLCRAYYDNDNMEDSTYHELEGRRMTQLCKNGNGVVALFADGTRIIFSNEDEFRPEYPLSVDVKITDKCARLCPFCSENSTPSGRDGRSELVALFESLPTACELALGGGNVFESGLLDEFIKRVKKTSLALTINSRDIDSAFGISKDYAYFKLFGGNIRAVGISVSKVDDGLIRQANLMGGEYIQVVWHVIAGVTPCEDILRLAEEVRGANILILGFKTRGRGEGYKQAHPELSDETEKLKALIPRLREKCRALGFDCLALSQLEISGQVSKEEWKLSYLGAEGKYSFFIDLVKGEYAPSSNDERRFKISDGEGVKEMFARVRETALMDN